MREPEENRLIIFDLDGVLIDSRDIHYTALNIALRMHDEKYVISREDHLARYDALPTRKKLEMLTKERGLEPSAYDKIFENKQRYTAEYLATMKKSDKLIEIFKRLKYLDFKICVASNSVRSTVYAALVSLGIIEFVDHFISNEDVKRPKPYPEMYWECMKVTGSMPTNTFIIEDSHIGREAVLNSGANLIAVENPDDVTLEKIWDALREKEKSQQRYVKWSRKKLNVLIPMAGAGSRFQAAGYTFPKPLIEVHNKPMIQVVVDNLNVEAHFIYLVQREHYVKYNLKYLLNLLTPGCDIVLVDGLTEGAACTALLAEELIDSDQSLLIANSDQFVEWNSNEVMYAFSGEGIDGGILAFQATHPKWSYVALDEFGFAKEVAEKRVISDNATVGIYFWKKGSDFVKYAKQMIAAEDRTNNEFYIAPTFNYAIKDGKKIRVKYAERMYGLGTPEDLNYFLQQRIPT